jgi:hypothetical protein
MRRTKTAYHTLQVSGMAFFVGHATANKITLPAALIGPDIVHLRDAGGREPVNGPHHIENHPGHSPSSATFWATVFAQNHRPARAQGKITVRLSDRGRSDETDPSQLLLSHIRHGRAPHRPSDRFRWIRTIR